MWLYLKRRKHPSDTSNHLQCLSVQYSGLIETIDMAFLCTPLSGNYKFNLPSIIILLFFLTVGTVFIAAHDHLAPLKPPILNLPLSHNHSRIYPSPPHGFKPSTRSSPCRRRVRRRPHRDHRYHSSSANRG